MHSLPCLAYSRPHSHANARTFHVHQAERRITLRALPAGCVDAAALPSIAHEPTLNHWPKLQRCAPVWLRRIRHLHLLSEVCSRARAHTQQYREMEETNHKQ